MAKDLTQFIEQLKDKNDIADVIGRYVTLDRNGNKLWGRCPFHHEKTPSFAVNTDGQYFHCFGCSASGDVIKFIQEIESLDFMESVEFLCEKSGMEMPKDLSRNEDSKTQELKSQRDRLYQILKETARFYFASLKEKGEKITQYLNKRGVTNEFISKFGIGFSPDTDALIKYLTGLGFKAEDLKSAGVAMEKNGRLYDPLGTRLIIPIINAMGDVIAFGGRDMDGKSQAKYKNTAETPVFLKSKNLYAINLVKKQKQEKGTNSIIVVEGYMDAIALHQAGFGNTVASMGTSLTKEQAKLIKRFCDEVYICYDGDSAGQSATLRGLDILKNAGLNVKVITMPDGVDPDEYIKEHGNENFKNLLEKAPPLSDYKLTAIAKSFNLNTADGRRKYTLAAIKVIAGEENQIVKEELLKQLRDKTGLTYESLQRELENTNIKEEKPTNINSFSDFGQASMAVKAARFILYAVLNSKHYAKDYEILEGQLSDTAHIKIFQYIKNCKKEGKEIRISSLFEDNEFEQENICVLESGENITESEQEKCYNDCIGYFKVSTFENKMKILAGEFEKETDIDKRKELVLKIQELTMQQRTSKELKKK